MMPLLTFSLASFTISLLVVFLIKKRFSQKLLDLPNERSSHSQPIPRGGGIGFIVAFAITSTLLIITSISSFGLLALWPVLIPLTIIGILDDCRGVSAAIRYLVQLGSASIAVFYFGSFALPWFSNLGTAGQIIAIALSAIGITAFINFYNFMDGLDGLVAGCSAVQLGFLAFYLDQPLFWLAVAALLGFLWWNWSPAKIFMGDTGSTVLGATVAIALLNHDRDPALAWSALAVTLPIMSDAIYTLCRRLLRRENIFKAHRSHLYQRLQQSGWSHRQVATIYIGINIFIACSVGLLGIIGALVSLFAAILAIIAGEIYLKSHQTVRV